MVMEGQVRIVMCSNFYFPRTKKIRCFEKLDDKNLHKTMRLEICMIIPTLINVPDARQAMAILPVLIRVNENVNHMLALINYLR